MACWAAAGAGPAQREQRSSQPAARPQRELRVGGKRGVHEGLAGQHLGAGRAGHRTDISPFAVTMTPHHGLSLFLTDSTSPPLTAAQSLAADTAQQVTSAAAGADADRLSLEGLLSASRRGSKAAAEQLLQIQVGYRQAVHQQEIRRALPAGRHPYQPPAPSH